MLETPLVEFLMGIFAGTIAALLAVLIRTPKRVSHQSAKPRAPTGTHAKTRRARRNVSGTRRNTPRLRVRPSAFVQPAEETPAPTPARADTVSSCPSCGLQAPEAVMVEHFLATPRHRNPQVHSEKEETVEGPAQRKTVDESREALRTVLQMLVPPRAFGHRRRQKTENPLSDYVTAVAPA